MFSHSAPCETVVRLSTGLLVEGSTQKERTEGVGVGKLMKVRPTVGAKGLFQRAVKPITILASLSLCPENPHGDPSQLETG